MDKICYKCKIEKQIEYFNKNPTRKDGFGNLCKECNKKYQKDWYIKNRKLHILSIRKLKAKNRKCAREFLYEYLKDKKCVDCGEDNPIVLEFDHVRENKVRTISKMVGNGSKIQTILSEMEKCEIRCANCHRIKTTKSEGYHKSRFLAL